ncbi:hypothetical protein [Hyphomicrobium sp. CS1GBMeth3]|uniref:hypothetical protein n=1 Tax=Hyphomicrobium sp. CS1GBMeth3 TaxID=1892845 RepID=UPI000931A1F4|nr:hypothetical protein [Hyphomicrobium sp. CS1GBMeth3]
MNTPPDVARSVSIETTIEQLRYWVPTIADVASTVEARDGQSWLLSIEPHIATACPVAIALKQNGRFDISVAGETYEDCALQSLDQLVRLLERIVEGDVIQRRWVSTATGVAADVETLVRLDEGVVWRSGSQPGGSAESRDRHFLPYRRTYGD